METEGGTIDAADKTIVDCGFSFFDAVSVRFFAMGIVDVATEVNVGWGGGVGGCYETSSLRACWKGTVGWSRLEGLEPSGGIDDDSKVSRKRRTYSSRSRFWVDLWSVYSVGHNT